MKNFSEKVARFARAAGTRWPTLLAALWCPATALQCFRLLSAPCLSGFVLLVTAGSSYAASWGASGFEVTHFTETPSSSCAGAVSDYDANSHHGNVEPGERADVLLGVEKENDSLFFCNVRSTYSVASSSGPVGYIYEWKLVTSLVDDSCDLEGEPLNKELGICTDDNSGDTCITSGGTNPVDILTGYKHQKELINSGGQNKLPIIWYFTGKNGAGDWKHNYQAKLSVDNYTSFILVIIKRAGGALLFFKGSLETGWVSMANAGEQLISKDDGIGNIIGWELIFESGTVEKYSSSGNLQAISERTGSSKSFRYNLTVGDGGDADSTTLDQVLNDLGVV